MLINQKSFKGVRRQFHLSIAAQMTRFMHPKQNYSLKVGPS